MSEKPLLFSGPMVRAILAGQKTQTRRVCRVQPEPWRGYYMEAPADPSRWTPGQYEDGSWDLFCGHAATDVPGFGKSPYGDKGDRLWVRETWKPDLLGDGLTSCVSYRADGAKATIENTCAAAEAWGVARKPEEQYPQMVPAKWRPSIHMPRWACRLLLNIVRVRVERLQDISEEDARGEGADNEREMVKDGAWTMGTISYRRAFAELWDSINSKRPGCSWADNPWVWCVSFERIQTVQQHKKGASE